MLLRRVLLKMLPFTVKLLVALVCFTAVYLSTEAADTCHATTAPCIPGPPGRDGKDEQPGRDLEEEEAILAYFTKEITVRWEVLRCDPHSTIFNFSSRDMS